MNGEKIIIFYPHILEYGGIERNIIALSIGAIAKGYIPVLICFYDNITMQNYVEGLEVVVLGDHWSPFKKGALIKKWFKNNQQTYEGLPLFFGGKAGFYAALSKIDRYALHYTDPPSLLSEDNSSVFKKMILAPRKYVSDGIFKRGVTKAMVCITMTEWNARELEILYGKPFDVVYQGGVPPMGVINTAQRCMGNSLRLFSICRLTTSKNIDWILQAAFELKNTNTYKKNFQTLKIILAGKGPALEFLKQKTIALGLLDEVEFPGFLTSEELEDEYALADIFLVPGRQGYGLPVLEALYRHVPVILNKESRISEILETNPWIAISENTNTSFTQALEKHIEEVRNLHPDSKVLDALPTESYWAREIGKKCNWW